MKVLVFADVEGISGIDDPKMLSVDIDRVKTLTTGDINAAIRGLRRAGVSEIDIFDGHGMGGNIIVEDLEEGANCLGGGWMTLLRTMIDAGSFKSYDAVVLVGLHAAEGTADGFISHTNTGMTALRINGNFAGESPQIAWLAGHFDVPTVLVSGDDAVVREAKALLPGIEGVVVKKSSSRTETKTLPGNEAHTLIEEMTCKSIQKLRECKPFKIKLPITVEILFLRSEMAETLAKMPRYKRTDDRTVSYTANDFLEAFDAYHACRTVVRMHILEMAIKQVQELEAAKDYLSEWQKSLQEEIPKETAEAFPLVKY
ncbi:MAG: M55 family metallopeptidase [Candidatus Heimdallarchaeota archaeon]